jgi:penicillin-binding protein 1B
MIKKSLIFSTLILLIALIAVIVYGWHLSGKVEARFSSRRWSIPSKVFSDTMLLYPGQHFSRRPFQEKLLRLGYRKVSGLPKKKGDMQTSREGMRIFLYDLMTPWKKRAGFPVHIHFGADTIASIAREDNGKPVSLLEIEPEEIMLFFGRERESRRLVSIQKVPEHFIQAVLAAEDHRFFQHWGIDPRGILRALITNLRHGTIRQGGSTITQQLAKNYFLTPVRSLVRKLQEALLALVMESKYSKHDILEIYLNEIYLGQKGSVAVNGIGEAANFYFAKPVQELSLSEAATIAGLIKAPNHYSPCIDKTACRKRRDVILKAMQLRGSISDAQLQEHTKAPVTPAGYTIYGKQAPYFMDYLAQQLTTLYKPEELVSLGLSIYTTLDPQVQIAAENALTKELTRLESKAAAVKGKSSDKKLQGAVVVMQPKTGHILAMVGGRNYSKSQFNRITQSRRQPGSAFKPFVYVTGLDTFTPITILANTPRTYNIDGKTWAPKNFDRQAKKQVSVRTALENSDNLATVDLALQVGLQPIIETATRFGFSTPFKPYPSLALGAFEVIPLELARAYCAFAAGGMMPFPLGLKAVVDENGHVLERKHLKIERLISPSKAFLITSLLRGVVENGTGRTLRDKGIRWPVAGKTGTTNNFRDAWFIAYTPDILALVWVGFDNGESIKATGARAALPIWAELMKAIPHQISHKDFRVPDGIVTRMVCDDDGKPVVSQNCAKPRKEFFLAENAPPQSRPQGSIEGVFKNLIEGIKDIFNGD